MPSEGGKAFRMMSLCCCRGKTGKEGRGQPGFNICLGERLCYKGDGDGVVKWVLFIFKYVIKIGFSFVTLHH